MNPTDLEPWARLLGNADDVRWARLADWLVMVMDDELRVTLWRFIGGDPAEPRSPRKVAGAVALALRDRHDRGLPVVQTMQGYWPARAAQIPPLFERTP